MFLLISSLALAAPDAVLGLTAAAGNADRAIDVEGRVRLGSGWQLGLHAQGYQVQTGFIDGWPVSGTRAIGTVIVTAPVIASDTLRLDVEADLGALTVRPSEGVITDPNLSLVADISPMVTLPGERGAVRVGWVHLLHYQIQPSAAMDAQGVLLRAEVVAAATDNLQLVAGGQTGGVFGFNGDGGKYLAAASVGVRWVPGAARDWTNF